MGGRGVPGQKFPGHHDIIRDIIRGQKKNQEKKNIFNRNWFNLKMILNFVNNLLKFKQKLFKFVCNCFFFL